MRRWIPLGLFAGSLGLMALCRWSHLTEKLLRRPQTYLGLLPVILGAGFALAGLWQLRIARTTIKAFGKPSRLVTGGVYRYSRNPIYLGLAVILVGACVLYSARCMLVPVAAFVLAVNHWVIRVEEKILTEEFGREYEAYRVGTGRWI